MISMLLSVESASFGAGLLDAGIVCASTAASSAVRPTLSAMLTSMPASISAPAASKWPFISASTSAVWLSGSISLMLAPADDEHLHAVHAPSAAGEQQWP